MVHILMISMDAELTQVGSASWKRHTAYADALAAAAGDDSRITIVAKTPANAGSGRGSAVQSGGRLTAIPTRSANPLTYAIDAVRLARQHVTACDLVTSQDPFASGLAAWWLGRAYRAPFLLQNFSTFFDNPAFTAESPLRNRALVTVGRWLRRQADFYRVSNQPEYDSYRRAGGDPPRCRILPVSTASEAFADAPSPAQINAARQALALPPDAPVVLWVGHPVSSKRIPLLFAIFRRVLEQMPDARLVMIGDMSRSPDDLAALARETGISSALTMYGPIAHDELPAHYALGRVYVHTSSYEGVPRVLMEAGASGLPIVAVSALGVDPAVDHERSGVLIPDDAQTIETFAGRVVGLLRDPARAQQMGDAARQKARQQFDPQTYTTALVQLYLDAIALGRKDAAPTPTLSADRSK